MGSKTTKMPHIELKVAERHQGDSPTVRLAWCVHKDVLEELTEQERKNLHMALVTTMEDGFGNLIEAGRVITPLERGAAYPEIPCTGSFKIIPIIVWDDWGEGEDKMRVADLLKRGGSGRRHGYDTDLVYAGGAVRFDFTKGEALKVTVEGDYFAKNPPKWLSWWVNLFWSNPPREQCEFRRRAILAFTIQPILIAIWLPVTTICRAAAALLLGVLLGFRRVNYLAVVRPWREDCSDVWSKTESCDSIYLTSPSGKVRPMLFLLSPLVLILGVVAMRVWLADWGTIASTAALVIGAVIALFLAIAVVANVVARTGKEQPKATLTRKALEESIYGSILCKGDGTTEDLATRKRSIFLAAYDLKAKICRPFERRV